MAVELYVTSTPSTAVQRTEISRLAQLLDVKKVAYTTVRERRGEWMGWRAGASNPQSLIEKTIPSLSRQVDLATDRDARDRMTAASGGVAVLPQLHVGGKVRGFGGNGVFFIDFSSL